MGGQNASLGGRLTDKEEIIKLRVMFVVVNDLRINNSSGWRVLDIKLLGLLEESLIDSFVDNN